MSGYFHSALAALLLVYSLGVRTVAQVEARDIKRAPNAEIMRPKTIPKSGAKSLVPATAETGLLSNTLRPAKKSGNLANYSHKNDLSKKIHLPSPTPDHPSNHLESHLAPGTAAKSGSSVPLKDSSSDLSKVKPSHAEKPAQNEVVHHPEFHEPHEHGHHHPDPCEKLTGAAKETCEKKN